jgi:VanZ family protein
MLWQRPWWTTPGALALGWAVLLVYGTLLPFDLAAGAWIERHGGFGPAVLAWLTAPGWVAATGPTSRLGVPAWASDVAANLVLYLPLGVLLRLALGRIGGWLVPTVLAVTIASGLSWLLECTQAMSQARYSAIQDWLANTAGAATGAALAVKLRDLGRRSAFVAHRLTSPVTLPVLDALRAVRRRATRRVVLTMLVTACSVAVGSWYGWVVLGGSSSGGGVSWLPFYAPFREAYDVAAVRLLKSGVVYAAVAVLVALPLARHRPERAVLRLAAATAVFALGVEVGRAVWFGASIDATEPVLAVTTAVAVIVAAVLAVDAVRRSCRRRREQAVAVDRRRRAHDYRFAR